MEDKNTVDTQTTSDTTTVDTQQNEVKTFTQEQLDQVVDSRLKRTKETIAKKLGLESYSDEALESFVTTYKELGTKVTTLEETVATKENILFEKDLTVNALTMGVTQENIERVSKLVKADMQDNEELDVSGALKQVLEDYPFFTNGQEKVTKVGIETKTTKEAPDEVESYLNKKYKNSKYYRG